jgi:hypothetical protein
MIQEGKEAKLASAHDTHDWDSAQTPVLLDAVVNGRPRKLVATAAQKDGRPLWHSRIGNISNAPQTYTADSLYAYTLY